MYYIQIDDKVTLAELATKVRDVQITLLMDETPRVILKYKGMPFATNVPVDENIVTTGNAAGMINGNCTNIQLFADNKECMAVDMIMDEMFKNGIMSMVMKVESENSLIDY